METIPVDKMPHILEALPALMARLEAGASTNQALQQPNLGGKVLQTQFGELKPDETPVWLTRWMPSDNFQALPPLEQILQQINMMQACTVPARTEAVAVMLEKACAHFGVPDNWNEIVEDYLDELSTLPADMLDDVWRYARRHCKFFPKISELMDSVSDKIGARNLKLTKLKVAAMYARG